MDTKLSIYPIRWPHSLLPAFHPHQLITDSYTNFQFHSRFPKWFSPVHEATTEVGYDNFIGNSGHIRTIQRPHGSRTSEHAILTRGQCSYMFRYNHVPTFNEEKLNNWGIPRQFANEDSPWEPLKVPHKKKTTWKHRKPQESSREQKAHRSRQRQGSRIPESPSWWSYDCRFQDYGPYASFHVMCYFLGPSFVHYHNKHYTNFL